MKFYNRSGLPGIIILAALLLVVRTSTFRLQKPPLVASQVWGSKPVLVHFFVDGEQARQLSDNLDLSQAQINSLMWITWQENAQIDQLETESQAVLQDPALAVEQKAQWVIDSQYNQRVMSVLENNQQALRAALGPATYRRLVAWIERRWDAEQQAYTRQATGSKVRAGMIELAAKTYPRSFEVYATRYDAGDRKIVALPDKCLKFANGGAMQCDGYAYGQAYSVAISYEGNLAVALVGESGPWNVDDNYWSKATDPQPRRMFTDLPLGVPEAQAAYFIGYNGGLDQFGRLVTSPVAIDISRALADELGLGPGNNKVTVSFLWTESWDIPSVQPGDNEGNNAAPTAVTVISWETSTPGLQGETTHVVQAGQTLVGIATVYGIPLADLLALNGLTMDSVIQPGDKILVRQAEPTPTVTQKPVITRQATPTRTRQALEASTLTLPAPPSATVTPAVNAGRNSSLAMDGVLVGIIAIGVLALVLLAWGAALQYRKRR